MASALISITGLDGVTEFGQDITAGRDQLLKVQNLIAGLRNGSQNASAYLITSSATDAVAAVSEVTATTSGSLGTVINGTTVTTAFTSTQAGTAAQAILDINANTTVNKLVKASAGSSSTKFYVTAIIPGELGNCCTLTVTGTGASATGSGKLAGGTGNNGAPFSYLI